MTKTVAQLLDDAVRQLGELQAGQTLDTDTLTLLGAKAILWLNGLAPHVTGTAETLFDMDVSEDVTLAAGNARVVCSASATATLPPSPQDGWRFVTARLAAGATLTLAGNGALIAGSASNATPAAGAEYLYRADLNDWRSPVVSATSDTVPWPDDHLNGMAAMLAIEISAGLGLPVKWDTRIAAAQGETAMVTRYYRRHPALCKSWRYQSFPQAA